MSTVAPQPQPQPQPVAQPLAAAPSAHQQAVHFAEENIAELRIYSHSHFLYWWPVWVIGALAALLTWLNGTPVTFSDGHQELFADNRWVGLVFTIVLFLVIFMTNVIFRGVSSVVLVLAILFLALLFAYLHWWDAIIRAMPYLAVHMNLGFYIFFSALIFVLWACSVFIYDHMSYYVIRPGQIISDQVIGGAQKSYDTHGMVFEKIRQDLFRQWILGLGAGDLKIHTMGAQRETLYIPNVAFVDWKVQAIQKMIATRPSEFTSPTVT
ncbi:MAG TPA: hypothetical protein VFW33_21010 [Gemmataceae bacterium]|nr:hypothetical protein [Gemmataceae bacterium]